MKRRRKNKRRLRDPHPTLESTDFTLHFRLCHVCLYLNESEENAIVHCGKCGRLLSLESISPEDWELIRKSFQEESSDNWEAELEGTLPSSAPRSTPDEDEKEDLLSDIAEGKVPHLNGLAVIF